MKTKKTETASAKATTTTKTAKADKRLAAINEAEGIRAERKRLKAAKAAKPAKGEKPATKGATVLALIARKGGATAAELMEATGWQAHSLRGFLSTAAKKGLAKIASERKDGVTTYTA